VEGVEGVEDQQLEETLRSVQCFSSPRRSSCCHSFCAVSPAKYRHIVDMVHVAQSPPVRRATHHFDLIEL